MKKSILKVGLAQLCYELRVGNYSSYNCQNIWSISFMKRRSCLKNLSRFVEKLIVWIESGFLGPKRFPTLGGLLITSFKYSWASLSVRVPPSPCSAPRPRVQFSAALLWPSSHAFSSLLSFFYSFVPNVFSLLLLLIAI